MGSGASGSRSKDKPGVLAVNLSSSTTASQLDACMQVPHATIKPYTESGPATSASSSPGGRILTQGQGTLELTFLDEATTERVVRFHERPLGFEISLGIVPIRADNVYGQGQAKRLGVEMGWYVHKVNGIDLSGKAFDEQFAILKKALAVLPLSDLGVLPTLQSVEIVFEAGVDGQEVGVVFSKKPLGFEFDLVEPIRVKRIEEDCVARRHGVKVGWVVKKVAGQDLSERSFMHQVDFLKSHVNSLPDVTYCIAPPLGHSLPASTGAVASGQAALVEGAEVGSDGRL
jgi:hypothetical protein